MLRINQIHFDSKPVLMGHGYHEDERGRKYVRLLRLNYVYIVQVKLQPNKDLHVISFRSSFPYRFTNSFIEFTIFPWEIDYSVHTTVDDILGLIWFE